MIKRWIFKIILFFTLIGMFNIFLENECILALICTSSILLYMIYRLCKLIYEYDSWGDVTSRYKISNPFTIGFDNANYLNNDKNIFVNGSNKTYNYYDRDKLSKDEMKELLDNFKKKENKIEIIETINKEVIRPIVKEENNFTSSKRLIKKEKKKEEKITINPSEFNQDLIMLVNSEKLSKDVTTIYDCIISALKELKHSTSSIANILTAFPYIDFVGNQAVIYTNTRQHEGLVLSKIKRYIIKNINEKFKNEIKTTFEDLKYVSVLDYFAKNNAV